MSSTVPVFDHADFDRLKSAQRKLHDLQPLLDKAEKCGVECQQFRQLSAVISEQLTAIEREFMSGREVKPPEGK